MQTAIEHSDVLEKASAPHREYIDRKKENNIFTHA